MQLFGFGSVSFQISEWQGGECFSSLALWLIKTETERQLSNCSGANIQEHRRDFVCPGSEGAMLSGLKREPRRPR